MKTDVHARELMGKQIIGAHGWRIGRVKDVVLDTKTWEVKALEVTLAKNVAQESGLSKTLRSTQIPIRVQDVQGMGDAAITLKISKAQFHALLRPATGGKTSEASSEEKATTSPETGGV